MELQWAAVWNSWGNIWDLKHWIFNERNFNELIQFSKKILYIIGISLDWFCFYLLSILIFHAGKRSCYSRCADIIFWSLWTPWSGFCCQELFVFCCIFGVCVFFSCCSWPDKDDGTLSFRKRHCRRINAGGALVPTLTALLADSLWLWIACLCSGSFHKLLRKGLRSLRGVEIVHFGDEQPQRGASSALRDRYLATGCHVAKTKSCLGFFSPLSLPLFHFHPLLCMSYPPLFSDWLVKGWTPIRGFYNPCWGR